MIFTIVLLIFLAITFLVLLFFYIFLAVGMFRTGTPFIPRPIRYQDKILALMELKKGQKLFDLGCGDATFLITAEKKYGIEAIGFELSLAAMIISRLNVFFKKSKAKIYYQDFFKADISQADVIFCYLFPSVMNRLSEKFKKELKPGAKIYSLAFAMSDWPGAKMIYLDEEKKKGKFYIYEK